MFDPKTRVLIIDDMMTMRKIVGKVCRELGFTDITEASDGALGWQAISSAERPFGIVISDWNMPNCTGLDLLKRVRGDKRFAHLPFLLVTAESEKHQIVEALKSGVSSYIVKPFNPETLKEKLQEAHQKVSDALKAG
jgi:two-component system chemotaxis response regulator CheY